MPRKDPLPVFCFKVRLKIAGYDAAAEVFFKSVSGIKSETEIVPVKEGGLNDSTWNLVGGTKWGNLVFKQGFTGSSALLDWRAEWLDPTKPKNRVDTGEIIILNTALKEVGTWTFVRGWPAKWEIGEFDASKSELAIETLEIAHEGITYKAKG